MHGGLKMKKIVAVLLSVALALTSLAALAEGAVLMPVELNVDSLEYVDETHYLIARDADSSTACTIPTAKC